MEWISDFHLFLFDFDGLLVNTEKLHYGAYKLMCAKRGYNLSWDWVTYSRAAMFESTGLKEAIYREFPNLQKDEPRWEILYKEKKTCYLELLEKEEELLMPGVEPLLLALQEKGIRSCVVTHSPREQIELILGKNPLLKTIPHWITREDYTHPKPHKECYEKAIGKWKRGEERVVGFEDSPRGFQALAQNDATLFFISSLFSRKDVEGLTNRPFHHFPTLQEIAL